MPTRFRLFNRRWRNLFMISKRQKVGVLLLGIAMVAWVIFVAVEFFNADWHYFGGASTDGARVIAFSAKSKVSQYFLVPIFLCGTTGVACLAWPSRKPPRLNP